VEDYWLGILGPSTVWLLRRLAAGFEYSPEGFDLDLAETARSLGLGDRSGRHSPLSAASTGPSSSAWHSCQAPRSCPCADGSLRSIGPGCAGCPRYAGPPRRWQEQQVQLPADEHQLRRARQLALSLMDLGDDYGAAERQLLRWRYPGSLARQAWSGRARKGAPGF